MTAIEFLENAIRKFENWNNRLDNSEPYTIEELQKDFQLSKELFKKQIKDAYNEGRMEELEDTWLMEIVGELETLSNAENYYNETFKK